MGERVGFRDIVDEVGRSWSVWNTQPSTRNAVADALRAGWLTFECAVEKRRLSPIPDGWEQTDDASLLALLETATPVGREMMGRPGGLVRGPPPAE